MWSAARTRSATRSRSAAPGSAPRPAFDRGLPRLRQLDDVQLATRTRARDEGARAVGRDRDAAAGDGEPPHDGRCGAERYHANLERPDDDGKLAVGRDGDVAHLLVRFEVDGGAHGVRREGDGL